jgi:hypothetical protein
LRLWEEFLSCVRIALLSFSFWISFLGGDFERYDSVVGWTPVVWVRQQVTREASKVSWRDATTQDTEQIWYSIVPMEV